MKKFGFIFCFILIFSMSFFAFNLNLAQAETEEFTPVNSENMEEILEDFDADGNYILEEALTISFDDGFENFVIDQFSGNFDGNGKTITLENLRLTGGNAGLFGKLVNAKISNLCVVVNVDAQNGGNSAIESALNFGGIAGWSVGGDINGCKTKVNFKNQNGLAVSSNYSINFGGIVGKSEGTNIYNSFSQTQLNCSVSTDSNFGGIVGKITNGSIENCYSAPKQEIIDQITGVVSDVATFEIENTNPGQTVAFGGIVGYAEGTLLSITNTLNITYLGQTNVVFGGIIGKLTENTLLMPQSKNITYCKYLKVENSTLATFNAAIGNSSTIHSSNEEISSFPTSADYFENGTFSQLKNWDFNNVWKKQNIYGVGGIFLPDLQRFSELTINLQFENYKNFYDFYFEDNPNLTSKSFPIGSVVRLKAQMINNSNLAVNPAKFYQFVCVKKVGEPDFVGELTKSGDVYGYDFICSNATAGSYYVEIKGNPVDVNVFIQNEEEQQNSQNNVYGKVKFLNEEKLATFNFSMNYADNGDAKTIEALEVGDEYKFSKFSDSNKVLTVSKTLTFKLSGASNSPTVFYDETTNSLKCNIYATFSNNTTDVKITLTKDAGKIIINNEEITASKTITLIANKDYNIQIISNEGYELKNILLNNEEINLQEKIKFSKLEENEINKLKISFSKTEETTQNVNIWWIIIPIVSVVVLGGIIALIIVSIKRKNANSYKKHFRY